MAIDPICGMVVDERSPLRAERDGQTFYFCCESCRRRFLGEAVAPAKLAHGAVHGAAPTAYICPMCPGVRSPVPAACPECGMALEPEHPCSGTLDDTTELDDMTRRLLIATPPTLIIMALAMGPMLGMPLPQWLAGRANGVLQAVLAAIVLLGAGWPILQRGLASIATGRLNMFTLIGVGTVASYLFSVAMLWLQPLPTTPATASMAASVADPSSGASGNTHSQPHSQPNSQPHAGPHSSPHLGPYSVPHAGQPSGPNASSHDGHGPALYFESAAAIMTLVLLGQVLELRARRRTGDAVRALLDLAPPVAHLWSETGEIDTPLAQVRPGDRLAVRPGEKVPVDGVLLAGAAAVSEALLTGEPMPIAKAPGDRVLAGSLNQSSAFTMRAEHTGADTLLAKIIQLVTQAQRSRAPIQRIADRVAAYFVPAVLAIAVLTFAAWWSLGGEGAYVRGLVHAVSVLVIACPCALGLATPMSVIVGVGRGAREGVLVRDAETLEQLARIDTVVLDKTGTLTVGRPELRAILALTPFPRAEILRLAAAVERWSEHPLGRAIVAAQANESADKAGTVQNTPLGIDPGFDPSVAPADFVSAPGGGVAGIVEGRTVRVGSLAFCESPRLDEFSPQPVRRPTKPGQADSIAGSTPPPATATPSVSLVTISFAPPREFSTTPAAPTTLAAPTTPTIPTTPAQPWPDGPWRAWSEQWRERGCTVLFVAVDGQPAGLLALHDPIKPEAAAALAALRQRGLRLAMATGDNERTALEVARQVAQEEVEGVFDEVRAGLSPGGKLAVLESFRHSGRHVAMLGDGVNDAPTLAAADVGVAMGTGSDVAIESAGVTLVAGDLAAFVRAVDLSRAVMRNIRQNLFFAFVYNGLGIPLAAGILQPVWGLAFGPMTAAVAMSFSSVSVIANSLRLARRR